MASYPWIDSCTDGAHWKAQLSQMPVQQLLDDAVAGRGDRPAIDIMDHVPAFHELLTHKRVT